MVEQLEGELNLDRTSLTPVDCLAIGYFISSVSLTASRVKQLTVYLTGCLLGDAGTKSLIQSICRSVDPHSPVNTHVSIHLWYNGIHEEGASHIAEVLNRTGIVSMLSLCHNPIGDKGLQTIFDTLKQNNTLKYLNVAYCEMTDTGVASLADALHTNNTLETLYIYGSYATENGLTCLVEVLSGYSGLVELGLPNHLRSSVYKMKKTINESRKRSGLAAIVVFSKYSMLRNDCFHGNKANTE